MPRKAAPEYYEPQHAPRHVGVNCFGVQNRHFRRMPEPYILISQSADGEVFLEQDGLEEDRQTMPSGGNYLFRGGKSIQVASFADQDITMANLRKKDFSKQDFSGAHQSRAYQYGLSDMLGGHGPSINTDYSVFSDSCFHRTRLCHIEGVSTCFCRADLLEADLNGSVLEAACFQDAILVKSILNGGKFRNSSFLRSDVTDARFTGSDLSGSCFSEVHFSESTMFDGANLTQTCFQNTNLCKLLKRGDSLFPGQTVSGADFRVDQTIAGMRLPAKVRLDLAKRGAVVDMPSDADWPEAAFYEGYLERP